MRERHLTLRSICTTRFWRSTREFGGSSPVYSRAMIEHVAEIIAVSFCFFEGSPLKLTIVRS